MINRYRQRFFFLALALGALVFFQNFAYPVFQNSSAKVSVGLIVQGHPLTRIFAENGSNKAGEGSISVDVPLTTIAPVDGVMTIPVHKEFSLPGVAEASGFSADVVLTLDVSSCSPRVISCTQQIKAFNKSGRRSAYASSNIYKCESAVLPPSTCATDEAPKAAAESLVPASFSQSSFTTVSGLVYRKVATLESMGSSYQDPSGLIWSDAARDHSGNVLSMSEVAGAAYCAGLGPDVRLPNKEELLQLREAMSKVALPNQDENHSYVISQPAMPALDVDGDNYWSSTPDPKVPGNAWSLLAPFGRLGSYPADGTSLHVRCVLQGN